MHQARSAQVPWSLMATHSAPLIRTGTLLADSPSRKFRAAESWKELQRHKNPSTKACLPSHQFVPAINRAHRFPSRLRQRGDFSVSVRAAERPSPLVTANSAAKSE